MEKKKPIKVSISVLFLILAIIAIGVMAYFMVKMNNEKIAEMEKSAKLQEQANSLNETVSTLQGKIDTIAQTIKNNANQTNNSNQANANTSNENEILIEGTFAEEASDGGYEFDKKRKCVNIR